jgi:FkbM family methyltransferase
MSRSISISPTFFSAAADDDGRPPCVIECKVEKEMSRWLLDSRTRVGSTIGDFVLSPVERAGITPLVVDVGARNGMYLLPESYTRRASLIGFEPNPEECRKLMEDRTDAQVYFAKQGIVEPRFKAKRFHDCALWDSKGPQTLYVTRGAGSCTLMGPVKSLMRDMYLVDSEGERRRNASFFDQYAEVMSTQKISCATLDSLIPDNETVDFLKIDVEGGELRVLRGADRLLKDGRVLFIQTEFQLLPYYQEHPLLGDQQRHLADRGYRLIDLALNHRRYRRGEIDIPAASDRGMLWAGDAIFVRDPDENRLSPIDLHRLAALALVFRFSAFGLSLLRDAKLVSATEQDAIAQAIRETPIKGWKGRLLEHWAELPVRAHLLLKKALMSMRR